MNDVLRRQDVAAPWRIEQRDRVDDRRARRFDLPLWGILTLYGLEIVVGYIGARLAASAWLRR